MLRGVDAAAEIAQAQEETLARDRAARMGHPVHYRDEDVNVIMPAQVVAALVAAINANTAEIRSLRADLKSLEDRFGGLTSWIPGRRRG